MNAPDKPELILQQPLLKCERDENFIYIGFASPVECKRHFWLKVRVDVVEPFPTGTDPKSIMDRFSRTLITVERHHSLGAPKSVFFEKTIAIAELEHFFEMKIREKTQKKGGS